MGQENLSGESNAEHQKQEPAGIDPGALVVAGQTFFHAGIIRQPGRRSHQAANADDNSAGSDQQRRPVRALQIEYGRDGENESEE